MAAPDGFSWTERKNGDVIISHRGRQATVLRGDRASDFLDSVTGDQNDQELMARLTGNYKRGNERQARDHRRRQGR